MVETTDGLPSLDSDLNTPASPPDRQLLSILMLNRPGVLAHVCSSLGSRDYNIVAMAVARAADERYSRVIALLAGDSERIELARKRLECMVSVIHAENINGPGPNRVLEEDLEKLFDRINGCQERVDRTELI